MLNPAASGYAAARPSREELLRRGLPLVRRIAYRMVRRLPANVDVGDLIGAGSEGLLKAADAYDPARYPRFEPYAETRIRGAILDELRAADPMTRHGRRKLAEVTQVVRELTQELGRPPEEEEIVSRLGIELAHYRKLSEGFAQAPALARLGEISPEDVSDDRANPQRLTLDREREQQVAEAIRKLPERTQTVLALYYQEDCTQAEIAQILGVTEGRVCQIMGEATARIQAWIGVEVPMRKKRKRGERKRLPSQRDIRNVVESAGESAQAQPSPDRSERNPARQYVAVARGKEA